MEALCIEHSPRLLVMEEGRNVAVLYMPFQVNCVTVPATPRNGAPPPGRLFLEESPMFPLELPPLAVW